MRCPRCNSPRIQSDYHESSVALRLTGVRKMLCNSCGLEFKRFDPFGKLPSASSEEFDQFPNRRRAPRFQAHLPTAISLIEGNVQEGKASYSEPSRGHCDAISKIGMTLTFVGTRLPEAELTRDGRLLFVRVDLPEASIEAVVSIVTHERVGEEGKRRWSIGVSIHQMTDADTAELETYLTRRAKGALLIPE